MGQDDYAHDLKQDLYLLDYFGPFVVFFMFFLIIFIISATCILWCCISDTDDVGVYTKWRFPGRPRRQSKFEIRRGE